jgi:hypothetical protein
VLAEFIPSPAAEFLFYEPMKIPDGIYACLEEELGNLKAKVCAFFIASLEGMLVASMILLLVDLLFFSMNYCSSNWISVSLLQNLYTVKYQKYIQL